MATTLAEDFARRRVEYWQTRSAVDRAERAGRVGPRNPIASNVNYGCAREMYLSVTRPMDRPDPDSDAQERMKNGNVAAQAARRDLEDMGYEVIQTESPMEPFRNRDGKVVYTGRVDFKIVWAGHKVPVEAKECSVFVFEAVQRYEDLERFWWTRKYKGQILLYMLQNNEPAGVLLLTCQGRKRMIDVVLEDRLDDAEQALALGEEVVAAVEANKPPPYTQDPTVCRHCWAFGLACQPPIEEQGAVMLDAEGELYALLAERADAEAAHRRYEYADKRAKDLIKAAAIDRGICGEYAIAVTEVPVKEYTVKARVDRRIAIARVAPGAAADQEVA